MKKVSVAWETWPRSRMRPPRASPISHKNSFRPLDTRKFAPGVADVAGPGFKADPAAAVAVAPPDRDLAIQFILRFRLLPPGWMPRAQPLNSYPGQPPPNAGRRLA